MVIENVTPEVDGGTFAVKRTVGDTVRVEADVFADGHDEIACRLYFRPESETSWQEAPMRLLGNDRWQGEFRVPQQQTYVYRLEAWIDRFATWRRDLEKRYDARQDVALELVDGGEMIRAAAQNAPKADAAKLLQHADALEKEWPAGVRAEVAFEDSLASLMDRYAPREPVTGYDRCQRIVVDREKARFSAWYELFPRSTAPIPGQHGTFRTTIDWLPYIAKMGFDVLYLPPIHPIGKTHRKGKNNNPRGKKDDPGSPWAIGNVQGGHDSVHPDLGTLEDFRALVQAANARGIEVALDLALQCSPDHPWVRQHPSWFKHRPDGSIRYAENPPKKYEDIFPIDFETEDWQALWREVERVVRHWIDQGVTIFRVDNPHTKQFGFWEWLIAEIRADHPDVLFLAEAFTRPRTMQRLAKLGFSQSYTYFTWRNARWELGEYMDELTHSPVREYFRPNFWPNTPDILHEYLQHGGRPAFVIRLLLAATLSSNYGIYGPSFELCVNQPREPGSEEYLDSEKYEVKHWDLDAPQSLSELIARVNKARRENPALQRNDGYRQLECNNEQIFAYAKLNPDGSNRIVCVVNLDPHNVQSGWVRVPVTDLGLRPGESYEMRDLLDGARYTWHGEWNYVELNPHVLPGHVLVKVEWPEVGGAAR
ncbi:MAG TPA: alpha-1,4-glucan--maltose-1-phosphate maltosyltransferase [Dehalococcoidia bacterium]|nr:alpha-1,4-glucan--maltose-1-phosphate maltosyltransferase [Dehalococcoidia bacterium]